MVRWIVTFALMLLMGGILYLLNLERLRRATDTYLPDTSLPWDAFQAQLAAHKASVFWASVGWSALGVTAVAIIGIAGALAHGKLAAREETAVGRTHWRAIGYAILPFMALVVYLVRISLT